MADIQFFPIFNQSDSNIWADFTRIRAAATQNDGKMVWTPDLCEHTLTEYRKDWHKKKFSFAFGAWDGLDMVAFAQGDIEGNMGFVRGLYVLPKYQRRGIGATLLRASERALGLKVKYCDLVTRQTAQTFYKAQGYSSLTGTEELVKNISNVNKCATVPVFHCMPALARTCQKIAPNYDIVADADLVNDHHRPMFVYMDAGAKVTGFAVAPVVDPDAKVDGIASGVYVADKFSAAKSCLASVLNNYAKYRTER